MSKSENKSLDNLNRTGRKKGSKNKSTLVREALQGEWDDLLVTEGVKVFKAVVEEAQGRPLRDDEGVLVRDPETGEVLRGAPNIPAAKLVLERVIPVGEDKMKGKIQLGEGGLNIYIEKLEAKPSPKLIDGEVEEAQFVEVSIGGEE